MPDQKPTLEYGRPDPLKRGRSSDRVITGLTSAVLAVVELSAMLLMVIWCRAVFVLHFAQTVADYIYDSMFMALFGACGSLSLWLAWRSFRRLGQRKCD